MPLTLSGTSGVLDNSGAFVSGTAVNSTSGTSIDFTGIPSWVKRVTVMFNSVSTTGSSVPLIRVGTSSGVATTGYTANGILIGVSATQSTSGFPIQGQSANNIITGSFVITLLASNTWVCSGSCFVLQDGNYYTNVTTGVVGLSGALDRVRITATNGTDSFDAGSINILYD